MLEPRDRRVTIRVPFRAIRASALAVAAGVVAASVVWAASVPPSGALLGAASRNPANVVQAATVRLAVDPSGPAAFAVPAVLPGESIDRIFTLRPSGTTATSLSLEVVASDATRIVSDSDAGLQLEVATCRGGTWTGATASACVANQGAPAATETTVYRGPIIPRATLGSTQLPQAPVPVPLASGVGPGETLAVRLRASLPQGAEAWATTSSAIATDRNAVIALDWRASAADVNLAGTPLATAAAAPPASTPGPTAIPVPAAPSPAPLAPTPFPAPTAVAQPTAWPTPVGYAGYALAFDGAGDTVHLSPASVALASQSTWTMEAWIRPLSFSGPQAIYTENVAVAGSAAGMVLGLGLSDRQLVVGGWTPTGWAWTFGAVPASIGDGTWLHVGASRSASGVRLFVNGAEVAASQSGDAPWSALASAPPNVFRIGSAANPSDESYFHGEVDDVRLWTIERSPATIAQAREQRLAGFEAGLVGYYPVSGYPTAPTDGKGIAVTNGVSGAASGTLVGGVRYVPSMASITRPPDPYALALAPASDTGAIGDGLTGLGAVSVTGYAEPGNIVALYRNGLDTLARPVTDGTGTFTSTVSLDDEGPSTITAWASNGSGQSSVGPGTLAVTRDSTPPMVNLTMAIATGGQPTLAAAAGLAFAASLPRPVRAGEHVVIRGITSEAVGLAGPIVVTLGGSRSAVALASYDAATSVGTTYFSYAVSAGHDGQAVASVTTTDRAGNVPTMTGGSSFVVDTIAPTMPSIGLTGGVASTTSVRPALTGTSEVGTSLTLSIDGVTHSLGTSVGTWSWVPSADYAIGTHAAGITTTDPAGNQVTAQFEFAIVGLAYQAPVRQAWYGTIVGDGSATVNWTATLSGSVALETCGSVFDTTLSIGTLFDDDGGGSIGCGLNSLIVMDVNAGATYNVVIETYANRDGGAWVLNLRYF